MACPPISLNSLTTPNASPTPSTPPDTASSRLSVDTCRKSADRPTPSALRTAYSCCRCRPRTSSSAATFPQAIKSTSAGRAQQRQQDAAAVAIHFRGQRLHLRREAFEVALGLRLPGGDQLEFRLRLLRRGAGLQAPHHVPLLRLEPCRVGRRRNPKIHRARSRCSSAPAQRRATAESELRAASRRSPWEASPGGSCGSSCRRCAGSPLNFRCHRS